MAASAAGLKYEVLTKISIGARWLTIVKVAINAEEEEYKAKGIAISPEKLGLPDGLLDLAFVAGDVTDEKVEKAFGANIEKEKLVIFATGAEKKAAAELSEAEGKALKGYFAIVVAIGR
jgi:hypothetical protein